MTAPRQKASAIAPEDIERALHTERQAVHRFLRLYSISGADPDAMVYPEWTAKDVLAHIVAWHESFARNLADLAAGRKPTPPAGTLREVNDAGVLGNRGASLAGLRRRLLAAQRTIEAHIGEESIGLIPYRRGSRPYSRLEHLDVVAGHIDDHFWHVVQARFTGGPV